MTVTPLDRTRGASSGGAAPGSARPAPPRGGEPVLDVLADLRREVDRLQGGPAAQPVATHPGLEGLLQLRTGGVYGVDAASLAFLLMAGPSADGGWCGVVGVPDLGVEAAVATGVDPRRTILVPDPGPDWLEVTAALVDVLALVVVRPPTDVGAADASRLAARLRRRGGVLVAWGPWPRCDARLSLADVRWSGPDHGAGHLRSRRATVAVSRGQAPAARRTLWLPAGDLAVRPVETGTGTGAAETGPLRTGAAHRDVG